MTSLIAHPDLSENHLETPQNEFRAVSLNLVIKGTIKNANGGQKDAEALILSFSEFIVEW